MLVVEDVAKTEKSERTARTTISESHREGARQLFESSCGHHQSVEGNRHGFEHFAARSAAQRYSCTFVCSCIPALASEIFGSQVWPGQRTMTRIFFLDTVQDGRSLFVAQCQGTSAVNDPHRSYPQKVWSTVFVVQMNNSTRHLAATRQNRCCAYFLKFQFEVSGLSRAVWVFHTLMLSIHSRRLEHT